MKNWWKNIMWIMGAVLFYITVISAGKVVSAAEIETIVPTYVGIGGNIENASIYQYQIEEGIGQITIPVQVSRNGEVKLEVNNQTDAKTITMWLSTSSATTGSDVRSLYSGPSNSKRTLSAFIDNACTMYLNIKMTSDSETASVTVKAYQKEVTILGSDLQEGNRVSGYAHPKAVLYYKIAVKSSGVIKLETSQSADQTPPQIELLNSQKKVIGTGINSWENTTYIGVKKGTYYVKLVHSGDFNLRYTFKSIKVKKNLKPSKAIRLKKGKAVKGVFIAGSKKNQHYYKIIVNKNQKVNLIIDLTANKNDGQFTVMQTKTKNIISLKSKFTIKTGKNKKKLKLTKGDNYIVIGGGNGNYSMKWK